MPAKLLLLPNLLDESQSADLFLPATVAPAIATLNGLIAESEKAARRYLRRFLSHEKMQAVPLALLNEHTSHVAPLLKPLERGQTWGLLSDAGLPCIADPGAKLVALAREKGIEIETFVGPCSLMLALQLSGFSGQHFSFHGYLPREEKSLTQVLRTLEEHALNHTHIWIEAPYRTQKMVEILKRTLQPNTYLCVASNLTLPSQTCISQRISKWKSSAFHFEKQPAVFLLFREKS